MSSATSSDNSGLNSSTRELSDPPEGSEADSLGSSEPDDGGEEPESDDEGGSEPAMEVEGADEPESDDEGSVMQAVEQADEGQEKYEETTEDEAGTARLAENAKSEDEGWGGARAIEHARDPLDGEAMGMGDGKSLAGENPKTGGRTHPEPEVVAVSSDEDEAEGNEQDARGEGSDYGKEGHVYGDYGGRRGVVLGMGMIPMGEREREMEGDGDEEKEDEDDENEEQGGDAGEVAFEKHDLSYLGGSSPQNESFGGQDESLVEDGNQDTEVITVEDSNGASEAHLQEQVDIEEAPAKDKEAPSVQEFNEAEQTEPLGIVQASRIEDRLKVIDEAKVAIPAAGRHSPGVNPAATTLADARIVVAAAKSASDAPLETGVENQFGSPDTNVIRTVAGAQNEPAGPLIAQDQQWGPSNASEQQHERTGTASGSTSHLVTTVSGEPERQSNIERPKIPSLTTHASEGWAKSTFGSARALPYAQDVLGDDKLVQKEEHGGKEASKVATDPVVDVSPFERLVASPEQSEGLKPAHHAPQNQEHKVAAEITPVTDLNENRHQEKQVLGLEEESGGKDILVLQEKQDVPGPGKPEVSEGKAFLPVPGKDQGIDAEKEVSSIQRTGALLKDDGVLEAPFLQKATKNIPAQLPSEVRTDLSATPGAGDAVEVNVTEGEGRRAESNDEPMRSDAVTELGSRTTSAVPSATLGASRSFGTPGVTKSAPMFGIQPSSSAGFDPSAPVSFSKPFAPGLNPEAPPFVPSSVSQQFEQSAVNPLARTPAALFTQASSSVFGFLPSSVVEQESDSHVKEHAGIGHTVALEASVLGKATAPAPQTSPGPQEKGLPSPGVKHSSTPGFDPAQKSSLFASTPGKRNADAGVDVKPAGDLIPAQPPDLSLKPEKQVLGSAENRAPPSVVPEVEHAIPVPAADEKAILDDIKGAEVDHTAQKEEPLLSEGQPFYSLAGVQLLHAVTSELDSTKRVLKPYTDTFEVKVFRTKVSLVPQGVTNKTISLLRDRDNLRVAKLADTSKSKNRGLLLTRLGKRANESSTLDYPEKLVLRTSEKESTDALFTALKATQEGRLTEVEATKSPRKVGTGAIKTDSVKGTKSKSLERKPSLKPAKTIDKSSAIKAQQRELLRKKMALLAARKEKSNKTSALVQPKDQKSKRAEAGVLRKRKSNIDTESGKLPEKRQKLSETAEESSKLSKGQKRKLKKQRRAQDVLKPSKDEAQVAPKVDADSTDNISGMGAQSRDPQGHSLTKPKQQLSGGLDVKAKHPLETQGKSGLSRLAKAQSVNAIQADSNKSDAAKRHATPMEVSASATLSGQPSPTPVIPSDVLLRIRKLESSLSDAQSDVKQIQSKLAKAEERNSEMAASISALEKSKESLERARAQDSSLFETEVKSRITSVINELNKRYSQEGKAIVAMDCRPWSREDFFERLRSFRASTWHGFCSVGKTDPVECARHGWYNSGRNVIRSTDGANVCYDSDADRLRERILVKGHKTLSAWVGAACPENFRSLGPMALDKQTIRLRADSLRKCLNCDELGSTAGELLPNFGGDVALTLAALLWDIRTSNSGSVEIQCDWCAAKRNTTELSRLGFHPLRSHHVWCPMVSEEAWKVHKEVLEGVAPSPMEVVQPHADTVPSATSGAVGAE